MVPPYEVKPSKIHGRGLFARRRIRNGSRIGAYEGPRTIRDGRYVLWTYDDEGNEVGVRGRNELRFLNHSGQPNAEFRGLELFAIRNIQPGTEITFHYGDEWEHD